jgi:hypothetical protein
MGGMSSAHGSYEKCIQNLSVDLEGRDHLQHIGISGRIMLKLILMK